MSAIGDPASDPDSRVCTANDRDVALCGESVDVTETFARRDFERTISPVGDGSGIADVEL